MRRGVQKGTMQNLIKKANYLRRNASEFEMLLGDFNKASELSYDQKRSILSVANGFKKIVNEVIGFAETLQKT